MRRVWRSNITCTASTSGNSRPTWSAPWGDSPTSGNWRVSMVTRTICGTTPRSTSTWSAVIGWVHWCFQFVTSSLEYFGGLAFSHPHPFCLPTTWTLGTPYHLETHLPYHMDTRGPHYIGTSSTTWTHPNVFTSDPTPLWTDRLIEIHY